MKKRCPAMGLGVIIALSWVWMVLAGCGPRSVGHPDSLIDTTEYHVYNGFMFLKKERLDDAEREFERGLNLNPRSSAAQRGMGIVRGMKGDFGSAFGYMTRAEEDAETRNDKALASVGFMSLYTLRNGENWLTNVEESFRRAISFSSDLPDAYFQLGTAYKQAYRLADSRAAFSKVAGIDKSLVMEAQRQMAVIGKIEKAMPRSEWGKQIALLDRITRAQAAALLVSETQMDRIRKPVEAKDRVFVLPPDVISHPMKEAIEQVLQSHIQGLETFDDGTFRPGECMRRADFALVVADIITRTSGSSLSSQKDQETASPYKDVRVGAPYFDAVIITTIRTKVMAPEEGLFNPMGTLSGVDALLILRKVEERY